MSRMVRAASAIVLVVVLVAAALVIGARLRGGDGSAPVAHELLEPLPTRPSERWRLTPQDVFGDAFAGGAMSVLGAHGDVLILHVRPARFGREAAVTAVDANTGRPLWSAPRRGDAIDCAFDGGGRLACASSVRDTVGGPVVSRVDAVDPRTGAKVATVTVPTSGGVRLVSGDSGFVAAITEWPVDELPSEMSPDTVLVAMTSFGTAEDRPDEQVLLVGIDASGRRTWSYRPPPDHLVAPGSAPGGGPSAYFALRDFRGDGLSVYRVDSGERVGELCGWRLIGADEQNASGVGDRILVESAEGSDRRVESVSLPDCRLRWSVAAGSATARWVDADRFALVSEHSRATLPSTQTWEVRSVATGDRIGEVTSAFGQVLMFSDGQRLLFRGAPSEHRSPDGSRLTAIDASSGSEAWRIDPDPASAIWTRAGRHLFLLGDQEASGSFVARYAT